jgi:hypothetical protein
MAFELKNSSPLKQGIDDLKKPVDKKFNKGMQSSLSSSNKRKEVSSRNKTGDGFMSKMSLDKQHPMLKAAVQIADPTGTTSYGDVKKEWNDGKLTAGDIIEPLSALPVVGKFGKLIKGMKIGTDIFKEYKASKVLRKVNKASDIKEGVVGTVKSSPLNQKLSPLAAKKKAARDLAYAKTDDRRAKKAHSQRMRRKDPNGKGKDWDHEDGRWESVKQNRGNEGEGTKKEGRKKYKVPK